MAAAQKQISEKLISEDKPLSSDDDKTMLIRDSSEILSLIKKITKHHALINVSIAGIEDVYSSAILEINKEENYLVLDELHPIEGNDKLEINKKITLQTQYQGAMVKFKSIITAANQNDDGHYYKIPIPDSVDFKQRRNTHRVYVGIDETIPVCLINEEDVMFTAELRDISLGGVSLRINEPSHVSLPENEDIPACFIAASDTKKIKTSLVLLHVEKTREKGALKIGAAFTGMSNMDRRLLEQFIAELERKMIKKIKRVV